MIQLASKNFHVEKDCFNTNPARPANPAINNLNDTIGANIIP